MENGKWIKANSFLSFPLSISEATDSPFTIHHFFLKGKNIG